MLETLCILLRKVHWTYFSLFLLVSSLGNIFVRSCGRKKHDITLTSEEPVKDRCTLKSFYHNNGVAPCHVASRNNYTLHVTKHSSVYHLDINILDGFRKQGKKLSRWQVDFYSCGSVRRERVVPVGPFQIMSERFSISVDFVNVEWTTVIQHSSYRSFNMPLPWERPCTSPVTVCNWKTKQLVVENTCPRAQ